MTTSREKVQILLVEDDDIDAEAISRAFGKQHIANPIRRAVDGIEALAMLRGTDAQEPISEPYLILLDINLPRMNGIEFLKELRSDKNLRNSIVFMLTTSNNDRDKFHAYDNNVAGYILKSKVGDGFVNLTNVLKHYWSIIEFPTDRES